jgi:hypothetical protein
MSNIKNIIDTINSQDLVTAKSLIKEELLRRVGSVIEEEIEYIAPSMISEDDHETKEKEKEPKMRSWKKKDDKDDKDDKKSSKNESYESEEILTPNRFVDDNNEIDDEDEIDFDEFVNEIHEIVQEIEQETGEELTEEEILNLGKEYIQFLDEEKELSDKQKKIARQANPKDKITGADFEKLRSSRGN